MEEGARKRVVILGGGFAGLYTASSLEKALGQRDDFEITLINKENHFVFQPLLAEVVSGSSGLLDVVSPIRHLLPRTDLHVRDIESVDLTRRTITTSPGFRPHACVLPFDYLVLALGNVTDFRGLRGLPEHALPFKNLGDALHLRNHVLHALEEAAIEPDIQLRRQLLTFRVHHDLSYTVPSTKGGTDHVTLSRYPHPYYRRVRFDELDHGRVCSAGARL